MAVTFRRRTGTASSGFRGHPSRAAAVVTGLPAEAVVDRLAAAQRGGLGSFECTCPATAIGSPACPAASITFAATTSSGNAFNQATGLTNGECVNFIGSYTPSGTGAPSLSRPVQGMK